MPVPAFLDRALDALTDLPLQLDRDAYRRRLEGSEIALLAAPEAADDPVHREGFLLAANLAARLYPRIHVSGPSDLVDAAAARALAINPDCELDRGEPQGVATLAYCRPTADAAGVSVSVTGWRAELYGTKPAVRPAAGPAALAAVTLGMAELFRGLLADALPERKRRRPSPVGLDLLTYGSDTHEDLIPVDAVDLGRAHLVGAGAIGEAAVLALSTVPVTGTLVVIDPEPVALSNLQRYVLATADDVGAGKPSLVASRLRATSLSVETVETRWGDDARTGPGVSVALVALDSPQARIEVAASLPDRAYNAFTGPSDLGWSRHEAFGREPCLACLYWPTRPRPHLHEVIGDALGIPAERALLYLISRVPVGQPAPAPSSGTFSSPPQELRRWAERSLLDDLVDGWGIPAVEADPWRQETIHGLYRDGFCGGAIVRLARAGSRNRDVVVPLAPQSVFAGIMLGTQLFAAMDPRLAAVRAPAVEGRLDILASLPQVLGRPRVRTPGCVCTDPDFGGVPI